MCFTSMADLYKAGKLPITGHEKGVLHCLVFYENEEMGGWAWPRYETLAAGANISRQTAVTCVANLEKKGFIFILRRSGIVNYYKINKELINKYIVDNLAKKAEARIKSRRVPVQLLDPPQYNSCTTTSPTVRPNLITNLIIKPEREEEASSHFDKKEEREQKDLELHFDAIRVLDFFSQKTKREYEPLDCNLKDIKNRLKEGHSADVLEALITNRIKAWRDNQNIINNMSPITLFTHDNFHGKYFPLLTSQEKKMIKPTEPTNYQPMASRPNEVSMSEMKEGTNFQPTANDGHVCTIQASKEALESMLKTKIKPTVPRGYWRDVTMGKRPFPKIDADGNVLHETKDAPI